MATSPSRLSTSATAALQRELLLYDETQSTCLEYVIFIQAIRRVSEAFLPALSYPARSAD